MTRYLRLVNFSRTYKAVSCLVLMLVALNVPVTIAQHHAMPSSPALDRDVALELSQSAVGNNSLDYTFINQDGKLVNLHDFRGKPLAVNFIFTSCYHTCPMMTAHLKNVVKIARDALGDDSFSMISIGFDTKVDSPEKMRLFALQHDINFEGWDFLSADPDTIAGVTRDLGFSFAPSPSGFDHLAQTTVIDANGTVYRQVYGATFEPTAFVEPMKELIYDRRSDNSMVSNWINGIRLFCTVYDPASNRYYFDYSIFYIIAIGLLCLTSILVFVVRSWRSHDKNTA